MKEGFVALILLQIFAQQVSGTTYYVDSVSGNDSLDGKAEQTAWKTVTAVNLATTLQPGDFVKFKRGCIWREQLIPKSGSSTGGDITYTSYGDSSLPKPSFYGSIQRSSVSDWTQIPNSNLWTTGPKNLSGDDGGGDGSNANAVPNPSFDNGLNSWSTYVNKANANVTFEIDNADFDSAPASLKVSIIKPSLTGASDTQLYVYPVNLTNDQYILQFRAKASKPGQILGIAMTQLNSPWTQYGKFSTAVFSVSTEWTTITCIVSVIIKSNQARMTFHLGKGFESGTILHIDTISLVPTSGYIPIDVGNIIFNGSIGSDKEWNVTTVFQERQFSYDPYTGSVTLYCSQNPAIKYSSIELALTKHIISQGGKHHITYDDLDLRYGAAHGIGGGSTDHITIRNLEISWIGGGQQHDTVRYGNSIEFWCNATNHLVERNRIHEAYDAALTNQCHSTCNQINITYRYNIVSNAEYCFEYWNNPSTSITDNIRFENNICLYSGYGFGHTTRPDKSGRHLCFYGNTANTSNFFVRNNIFIQAIQAVAAVWGNPLVWYFRDMTFDYNIFVQTGTYLYCPNLRVIINNTGMFQNYTILRNTHSYFVDPQFVSNTNYRLLPTSPGIDNGITTGATIDFYGNPIPYGLGQDIGASEYNPSALKSSSINEKDEGKSGSNEKGGDTSEASFKIPFLFFISFVFALLF